MKALNSLAKLDRDNRQKKPHSKMEMRRKWRKQARVPWGGCIMSQTFSCAGDTKSWWKEERHEKGSPFPATSICQLLAREAGRTLPEGLGMGIMRTARRSIGSGGRLLLLGIQEPAANQ